MNAYLAYWKPEQVDWNDPASGLLRHAASQQYHKVRAGDRVYLLTSRRDKLYLIGSITVDAVLGRHEAASRLDCDPEELWDADYHILAAPETTMPRQLIECEDALRQLYVISGSQPQRIKEPMSGQRFQTMRQISPGSATILDDLILAHRRS
jgi:hypothetical protein